MDNGDQHRAGKGLEHAKEWAVWLKERGDEPVALSGRTLNLLGDVLISLLLECDTYRREGAAFDHMRDTCTGMGAGWVYRKSGSGRGMRLHESSRPGALSDPLLAVEKHMEDNNET